MTTETLVQQLHDTIHKHVSAFLEQKSEKAVAAEKEIANLQKVLDGMDDHSPARGGIEQAIASLEPDHASEIKQRREDAAVAMLTITNGLRLPLQLKPKAPAKPRAAAGVNGAGGGGKPVKRVRLDKGEREKFEKQVMKLLKGGKQLNRTEILDATGMDGPMYTAVTRTLKQEGDIVSEGRGRAATVRLS